MHGSNCIPCNPENKPWAYFLSKHFFWAYFRGGLIFGGAYFRDEICVRKEDRLIIEGCISATVIKRIRIRIMIRIISTINVFSPNFSKIVIELAKFSFSVTYSTNKTETTVYYCIKN